MTTTTAIVAIVVAVLALVGTLITAVLARRSAKESGTIDAWSKLTAAHQADLAAVRGEVKELRSEVGQIRGQLDLEQTKRQALEGVLRAAWTHIMRLADQVTSMGGHPDPAPAELTAWMREDGLVVDRVTVSRTVVTDTRTSDQVQDLETTSDHDVQNDD